MSDPRSIFITGASSGFGRDAAMKLEGYGSTKELFSTMAQTFADRPLRLPVGEDSKMASTPINEAQEQSQKVIMAHFGWE